MMKTCRDFGNIVQILTEADETVPNVTDVTMTIEPSWCVDTLRIRTASTPVCETFIDVWNSNIEIMFF